MAKGPIKIIGAGLAGSEAAWQLAERGVDVCLIEMRPATQTAIHKSGGFAELVCSNSMKSLDGNSAAGVLKNELAIMGSKLIALAWANRVPAGKALAVDRDSFSGDVTAILESHPHIQVERREFEELSELIAADTPAIICSGPLTSANLEARLGEALGQEHLAFFDAAAPIIEADSLDMTRLFSQSRYSDDEGDYLNAILTREQYELLVSELAAGQRVIARDFETAELFQACQPVEELARKGLDTLRFGALKPVGLTDPASGRRPWAVVQLRAENQQRTAFNMVGFQTNLSFSEQERIFRMIPGLEEARFARYGVMHRNTFIDAPRLLTATLAWRKHPHIFFAGQVSGTEGYVEAIASGLVAALAVYSLLHGSDLPQLPKHSVLGALLDYASDPLTQPYQPMHVNFGLMEALPQPIKNKQQRYQAYASRAIAAMEGYRSGQSQLDWLPRSDYGAPDAASDNEAGDAGESEAVDA